MLCIQKFKNGSFVNVPNRKLWIFAFHNCEYYEKQDVH